ncbi:Gfo/Idh/MocA family protein [Candidatus Latescibacterota bacterium]
MPSEKAANKPKSPEKNAGKSISRRSILSLGITAPLIVPRHVIGQTAEKKAPSDTLTIACVGVAGMGRNYLDGCREERIVALCDLDHNFAIKRGVFDAYPEANLYHDFRKMFDKEAKNFDALIVATPDHTHALLMSIGIQLGKHMYCAKPITHSIGEARKIRAAFLKNKHLITKSSIQDSATEYARSTTELLTSGVIGPVRELHIWTNHPACPCSLARPTGTENPPPDMDWDLWIGPAPKRPYHSTYHPENWRPWWDFGSGTVGDMACHTLHMYFNELRLGAPATIYGNGSTRRVGFFKTLETPECQSNANMVTWEFPARGEMPLLNVHWYDGGMKPHRPPELDLKTPMPQAGLLFVGDRGKLISAYYGGNPFRSRRGGEQTRGLPGGLLLPEDKFKDFRQPPESLRRVFKPDHYLEWTEGCKTGTATVVPIEFGCQLTEMALLGSLALRTGRLLEWDAKAMRITNDEDANSLIDPPYHNGWKLNL